MGEEIEVTGKSVNEFNRAGLYRHFTDNIWRPLITTSARSSVVILFFFSLLVGAFLATRHLGPSPIFNTSARQTILAVPLIGNDAYPDTKTTRSANEANDSAKQTMLEIQSIGSDTPPEDKTTPTANEVDHPMRQPILKDQSTDSDTHPHNETTQFANEAPGRSHEFALSCSTSHTGQTCPTYPKNLGLDPHSPPPSTCPEYFRWIYEDLRPWRESGITKEMVDRAKGRHTAFRLVIVDGKAYAERYSKSYQTREVFTLWGILQLLRKYPGKVPDLELMFDCVDWPIIKARSYRRPGSPAPPPLFRYCGDDTTLDIVFPDWSFWGWPDINIKPWHILLEELKEGNERIRWLEREPYAYWKGNPFVAPTRMDLLKCNVSEKEDWHARVYVQDWFKEGREGFKQSDLASQCTYRYKIYIEGSAWSVSEKYILACDSTTLIVKPRYYDFFSRGLMPIKHYYPIKDYDKCRSLKHAVEWGESHKDKAEAIGKASSDFIQNDLKMDYVYDYMLHLLSEYAKLLRFKPTIPQSAVELCSETMACQEGGTRKKFMMDSMVMGPSDRAPCTMPSPYDPVGLQGLKRLKANTIRAVEKWEKYYWDNQTMYH